MVGANQMTRNRERVMLKNALTQDRDHTKHMGGLRWSFDNFPEGTPPPKAATYATEPLTNTDGTTIRVIIADRRFRMTRPDGTETRHWTAAEAIYEHRADQIAKSVAAKEKADRKADRRPAYRPAKGHRIVNHHSGRAVARGMTTLKKTKR